MDSIVAGLADLGHRIHVVTALPWYRHHAIDSGWEGRVVRRERTPWGVVTRLHPFPSDKGNLLARAASFLGFTILALVAALRRAPGEGRPDVVLTMSPPLVLGVSGWLAARRWRVPLVFNIQDVFPDVAVEVGAITSRPVIAAATWLERFLYRRSAGVTVLSEDLRRNLAAKLAGHRPERVEIIPNFVDTERIVPSDRRTPYRDEFGLGDRTVVMYAGNLGFSQSVELLVDAAAHFAEVPEVVFVVNGAGSAKDSLVARGAGLSNLIWVGYQPRERLGEVLASADIHCVLLKPGLAASSVPSKTYAILAAGRPCVASIDVGSEVDRMLTAAQCGIAVPPDDLAAFTTALSDLLDNPAGRSEMGAAARTWVESWLSPAAVAEAYESLFERVLSARR